MKDIFHTFLVGNLWGQPHQDSSWLFLYLSKITKRPMLHYFLTRNCTAFACFLCLKKNPLTICKTMRNEEAKDCEQAVKPCDTQ